MATNIYSEIGKRMGKDVRLVRAAAHHPFEFYVKRMEDPQDHRPMRFRYLGVFFVKPYWRKGLKSVKKIGFPTEDMHIWARVPELKFNKVYTSLKCGQTVGPEFLSDDGKVKCPITDIQFWTEYS
jgi:hypothetical protein